MTVAVFAGFQTLLILNIGEFQNFAKLSWNSNQNSQNFGEIHRFPVKLTKHFVQDFQWCRWGCVDIFWNSPILEIN